MRTLSAAELLDVWEQGLSRAPAQQALLLLGAACPERSLDELARLSLGQRDAYLFQLRELIFGPRLAARARCPGCGERLELDFTFADIQSALALGADEACAPAAAPFRLPNSLDLAAITDCDEAAARQVLLKRCVLATDQDGQEVSVAELPADLIQAIVDQMALRDELADVQLSLSCPSCGRNWQVTFDIVSFFWKEVDAWAYRLLRDVHLLARAYGWSEAAILTISPRRRQAYLEMLSG